MNRRRTFIGLIATALLGSSAGCNGYDPGNMKEEDCPSFGAHQSSCTENAVKSVVLLLSHTVVTDETTVTVTLYNRTSDTFTQTDHWQMRQRNKQGEWERVGPDERNLSPAILEPGQSASWEFRFASDGRDTADHTIVPPEREETMYAFLLPGRVEDNPVKDYITKIVTRL